MVAFPTGIVWRRCVVPAVTYIFQTTTMPAAFWCALLFLCAAHAPSTILDAQAPAVPAANRASGLAAPKAPPTQSTACFSHNTKRNVAFQQPVVQRSSSLA